MKPPPLDWALKLMLAGQGGLAALVGAAAGWERALHQSPAGMILLAVLSTIVILALLGLKRDDAHD
ncbi:MAG: hypothetical protein ACREJR_11310 [Candidatus Rokuibacteriota bacterium]